MTQNTQSILDTVDPEILSAVSGRASEIAQGASTDSKLAAVLALGSIPIALGAITQDLYGQAPSDVLDVLQFALLLEYLEAELYTRGVASTSMITAATDRTVFTTIRDQEIAHVTTLMALITARGATPISKPTFDFTARGNVPGNFNFGASQFATFTALSQAFEDTGVRAYKGQVGRLVTDKSALTTALTIHSVEGRHASEVRRLRGKKGWITGNSRDTLPDFTQPIYNGEENVIQGGVDVAAIAASFGGTNSATEAFDEPLTKAEVAAILEPFLA